MARRNSHDRRPVNDIDGFLLVDKAQGWTSHDAVQLVRSRFALSKVGHGGTLDPMATGLLVLLLGRGTKCSQQVMDGDKEYQGTFTLGVTTDSQDADGEVQEIRPYDQVSEEELRHATLPLIGDILQTPPMVSAIKKNGVPLYKLARQGKHVEREARPVTVHSLEILAYEPPQVHFRTRCTKGTYVRTLVYDLGEALGCGAHLSALRRTASGAFSVENALRIESIKEMELDELRQHIIPLDGPSDR